MLQGVPICHQFVLMQFGPRFDQALLPARQGTGDHLHRIDAVYPHFLLIVCVKMWNMMFRTHLREHANDNAKELT